MQRIARILCVSLAALVIVLGRFYDEASAAPSKAVAWQVSEKVFGSHAGVAFCIAGWETGFTYSPTAVSPTNDHGLWQIHDGLRMYGRAIYNVWFNARIAYRMSHHGTDWSAWTTHWRCGV